MISLTYLIRVRPYSEEFLNKMEMLNETTNIIAVYLMISFTDLIDSENEKAFYRRKNMAGYFFIIFLLGLIAVHIATLASS